jgi:hypothetical protein
MLAAVDVDHLAGNPGRLRARQETGGLGDVRGIADARKRHAGQIVIQHRAGIGDARDQFRFDDSGPDAVDADTDPAQFIGGQRHHVVDGGVGRAVGAEPAVDGGGGDGGDRHEGAAAHARHLVRRVFERQHGAGRVEVQGGPPAGRIELAERPDRSGASRTGDHDPQRTAGGGVGEGGGNLVLFGDVGDHVA